MLLCDHIHEDGTICNNVTHLSCAGFTMIPEGKWYCDKCQSLQDQPEEDYCNMCGEDTEEIANGLCEKCAETYLKTN